MGERTHSDEVAQREDGAALIASERRRQVEVEGWTPEHDDEHGGNDLAVAGLCYLVQAYAPVAPRMVPEPWPWENSSWKPSDDPIRNLVKAGALIAAEIDRLRRIEGPK